MLAEIFGRYDLLLKECPTISSSSAFFLNHMYWVLLDAFSASTEKISICGEAVTVTL